MRRIAALALAAIATCVGSASAHVEVLPRTATQNELTEFTIRVPTEREVPTTAVRIDLPAQVTLYRIAPAPAGWTAREILSPDGRTTGITYRGGTIGPRNYLDFTVLAVSLDAGATTWKARQTYADGTVKPWTGPPDAPGGESPETGPTDPGPASAVEFVAAGSTPTAATAGPTATDESDAGVWLGIIAIVVAAAAFLAAAFLWTTRPMTLPEDDEPPSA